MLEPCMVQGFISEPNIRIKTKGLADCITQTASPFVCLNNLSQKYLSNFLVSLHLHIARIQNITKYTFTEEGSVFQIRAPALGTQKQHE